MEDLVAVGPEEYMRRYKSLRWFREDLVTSVLVPVRILSGKYDRITPPKIGAKLAARLVRGQAYVVPSAGHRAMEERPAAVARHILEMFQEVLHGGKDASLPTTRYGGARR